MFSPVVHTETNRKVGRAVDWRTRRCEITERVSDMYIERPWINISMEAVAERAGISCWQVYRSFDGQEDIYRAVVGKLLADVESAIAIPPKAQDSVCEYISAYTCWLVDLLVARRYCDLAYLNLRDGPSEPWLIMNFSRRIRAPLYRRLETEIVAIGRKHDLSLRCDRIAIRGALAGLEASATLTILLTGKPSAGLGDLIGRAKTELWRAIRHEQSTECSPLKMV